MKKCLYLFLVLALMFTPSVFARSFTAGDTEVLGNNDWYVDKNGNILPADTNTTITIGSTTFDGTEPFSIMFTPADFIIQDATIASASASTTPGLESDNSRTALVWADGETTKAQVCFRVPDNYSSGMSFRLFCDESGDTTRSQVDFEVYVNGDGEVWDSATSNQTPVALTELAGTAEQVTLSVATDFSALAAGDLVTVNIWRDDTATGTNELELYYLEAYGIKTTE